MPLVLRDIYKRIESDGEVQIAGIEKDKVIGAKWRNAIEEFLGKIAVRINQPHAVAGGDVLNNEVSQQGCFPEPVLPIR